MLGIRLEQYLIAQRARLSVHHAREVTNLGVAGMLHDIGKTKLPEHLRTRHQVNAGEKDQDRAAWEEHPQIGFEMVRNGIEASASAAIRQHHQRFDGSGYPQLQRTKGPPSTLAGNDIHVFARLLAAADLFDRLVVDREGKRRANIVVLHLMRTKFGQWFDPQVIETMAAVIPPFPPGMQVQLSDGTSAVVIDLDRDHPYEPKVRRVARGSMEPDGEAINLRRNKELRIVSINQVNVESMYPPEKKPEKAPASDNPAPVSAAPVAAA
jgi:HD-GYP domain-containing protein (c-di-GMP phosphodiesterase class II)